MKPIISYFTKMEEILKKKYPNLTWSRMNIMEHPIDKNNKIVYYEIFYRILCPSGRWFAIVIWQNGVEPKLKKVWRVVRCRK